jgi:hypothetical protein
LAKAGIKDQHNLNIFKTIGNASYTEFYYKVSCDKSQHKTVISLLKDACKDKGLADTVTQEKQQEEDDSSSESSKEATTEAAPVKVTQKDALANTAAPQIIKSEIK